MRQINIGKHIKQWYGENVVEGSKWDIKKVNSRDVFGVT